MRRSVTAVLLGLGLLGMCGCATAPAPTTSTPSTTPVPSSVAGPSSPSGSSGVPRFRHVVIVVEENHGPEAAGTMAYLATLRHSGVTFSDSHGVAHPSEPNYLALWSGSTHGVTSDACPVDLGAAPSLGAQLLGRGLTVAAYAEGLPSAGSTVCSSGAYARKHDPLADFSATSGAEHDRPFSDFPSDYSTLPSVSLVIPDLDHDAHNGSLGAADDWLRARLGGYATWAATHDSLLIVTFDEEDGGQAANRILTVFSGAHVRPGTTAEPIDHIRVLHTIEAAFGLTALGSPAAPITDVWR